MDLFTTYYWQIVSEDSQGLTTEGSIWSFTTEEKPNEPPTAPDIDGPNKGKSGVKLCWTFHSDDPEENDVKYIIDWGDGNTEETDYYLSCTPAEACHIYEVEGTYVIKAIAEDIKEIVDTETEEWGIDIKSIKMQEIELPDIMKRAMAAQAEAEREKRAAIIGAEGEREAAENLANAAARLAEEPGAMHLRTLQTIRDISQDPSQKIVIFLPSAVERMLDKL